MSHWGETRQSRGNGVYCLCATGEAQGLGSCFCIFSLARPAQSPISHLLAVLLALGRRCPDDIGHVLVFKVIA